MICLVVSIIGIEATRIMTFNGIKTKASCIKILNIISKSKCLGHCVITVNMIVMISHDEATNTCICCNDTTGSDTTGPNWKSYVPPVFVLFCFNQKKVLIESDLIHTSSEKNSIVSRFLIFGV